MPGDVMPASDAVPRDLGPGVEESRERPHPRLVSVEAVGGVGALQGCDGAEHADRPGEVAGGVQAVEPELDLVEAPAGDGFEHVHRAAV